MDKFSKFPTQVEMMATQVKRKGFVEGFLADLVEDKDLTIEQSCGILVSLVEAIALSKGLSKAAIARECDLARDTVYKTLHHKNPTLNTFLAMVKVVGYRVTLEPLKSA